jgi:hypothetical protein
VRASCGVDRWGLVAAGAARSAVVVVLLPVADHHACPRERPEHVDVQALVSNAAVERLDVSVAPGLPRGDEVQAGAFAGPVRQTLKPRGGRRERSTHSARVTRGRGSSYGHAPGRAATVRSRPMRLSVEEPPSGPETSSPAPGKRPVDEPSYRALAAASSRSSRAASAANESIPRLRYASSARPASCSARLPSPGSSRPISIRA